MSNAWPTVELREVMTLDLDKVAVDPTETYPMVGVLSFGKGLFGREPVGGSQTSYKFFYRLKPDHVVMSQLFGWEGALALSSPAYTGRFLSPQFPTFLCDSEKLDRHYLGWVMRRPAFWDDLGTRTKGMGDRRRTLSPESLLSCRIPLAPLSEQRRIVARIEELVAKIKEASSLKGRIKTEEHQMLLAAFCKLNVGAEYRQMKEVAPITRRPLKVDTESRYSELGIRSFGKGTFHKPLLNGIEVGTKKLFFIEPGDLVFNNVFAWEGAVAVSKTEDAGRVGSHRFIACVPKKGITTANFLCFYFLTNEGLQKLGDASPGGAGRNRTLGLHALSNIDVPLPSYEKQLWFDGLQAKVDALERLQAETAAGLDALLPSVLDKAFKGEF